MKLLRTVVQFEIIDDYSENVVVVAVIAGCKDQKLDLVVVVGVVVAYYRRSLEELHLMEERELERGVGSKLRKKDKERNEQRGYWRSRRAVVPRFRKRVRRCLKRSGRVEKHRRRRLRRIAVEMVGAVRCSRIRKRVVSLERVNSNCSSHSQPVRDNQNVSSNSRLQTEDERLRLTCSCSRFK